MLPERQRRGIGQALIRNGLERLAAQGAWGCAVFGDPAYYARFGFRSDGRLRYGDVPPAFFQRLPFGDARLSGDVACHAAFAAP